MAIDRLHTDSDENNDDTYGSIAQPEGVVNALGISHVDLSPS
jgi:hypothetical protein